MSKCFHHPETDAVGFCRQCGKGLCSECRREVRGVIYCEDCLANLTVAAAAPGGSTPALAAVLGAIPGVGAIYNGEYLKALIYIFIFGGTISLMDSRAARGLEPLLGIFLGAFWIYMIIEAYQTAKRRALGLAPAPSGWSALGIESGGQATPIGPLILIVIGVLFLLNTLDIFRWTYELRRFWPVILIALGAWLLWRRTTGAPR